ncbi:MAG: hypothetical protein RL222_1281 [Bacteroidota bacterium]
MKYYILIFSLFIVLGCKEKNDCCIVFDATVKVQFKDASGRDLLDQSKSYAYKHSNMKHLYLKHFYQQDDIKKEVYYNTADNPKQLRLVQAADLTNVLYFFPEINQNNGKDGIHTYTDYLQLNETDEDTIRCAIYIDDKSTIIKKIWYNDSLFFDDTTDKYKFFVIEK